MEILRYLIFLYCILGIFVAGGLFYSKDVLGNKYIALYILCFTLDQFNFLYETSPILKLYPHFFLILYPICLLLGPLLWFHFSSIIKGHDVSIKNQLWHFIPFILFISFFLIPLYRLPGLERISFASERFLDYIMPLNYIRTTHVVLYGVIMLIVIMRKKLLQKHPKAIYLVVIAIIYFLTAIIQSYLTAFANSYTDFAVYYTLAATIVLFAGVILYTYPDTIKEFQIKYFKNSLKENDKKRIIEKLEKFKSNTPFFLNKKVNLTELSIQTGEQKHHLSQILSEQMNISFNDYVNATRIEYAEKLLLNPSYKNAKIIAIAFESGFNNNVTFNKAFVKFTGYTPHKYRKEKES
mgnify:CR=1 FL=1